MKQDDFWAAATGSTVARAECKECTTSVCYVGSTTEVNDALKQFKELHKDCKRVEVR